MLTVICGFYFHGGDLFIFRDQKIDLHMVFPVRGIAARIIVELMSAASQHLRYDILHKHAFVDIELIEQYRPIKLVFRKGSVHKSVRDKQAGIGHIAFLH